MAGVGEALGAIGLATLFSTCVECFNYFKAAQRMEPDLEILLVKLDIEKTRLLVWGNTLAILNPTASESCKYLSDPSILDLIGRNLTSIKSLLSNADQLVRKYGLVQDTTNFQRGIDFVSLNSMLIFRASFNRFKGPNASALRKPSLLSRFIWAVHNKEAFRGFICDLKDLIDGLYDIAHLSKETLDATVESDVRSIEDLHQLRLFEEATEDSYRAWSEVASEITKKSETDTLDRRNINEQYWNEEPSRLGADNHEIDDFLTEMKKASNELLIVATRPCLRIGSTRPCATYQFGGECFSEITKPASLPFSHAAVYDTSFSLPRRIEGLIDIKANLKDALYDIGATSSLWEEVTDFNKVAKAIFPIARTILYCAPCVCSIQTSLWICRTVSSTVHQYSVRPDDRLRSSCCATQDGMARLQAIYDAVKSYEADASAVRDYRVPEGVKHIDMMWLEERLYRDDLEGSMETQGQSGSSTNIRNIIVGETEHLQPITKKMAGPRVPRETEIWKLVMTDPPWKAKLIGTFTARRLNKYIKPETALQSSDGEDSNAGS